MAIREYIDESVLSQTTFGKRTNMTHSMVGRWIRDDRPISVKSALAIEKEFGIDTALLMPSH